jgi:hypothetical protein
MSRFLCNTSGSGKTCITFEGLCHHWGFYFTARTTPDGVGSSDLEEILGLLYQDGRLAALTADNHDVALTENQELASRYFLRVLYARIVIFRIFIECASLMHSGITEDHKTRWLLLQVAPSTLLEGHDVFSKLTQLLKGASSSYLNGSVLQELTRVRHLLGPEPSILHTVLDEGQALMDKFPDCFRSNGIRPDARPVLRPLILAWTRILPNLIVSGTGMSMREVTIVLGSAVAKEGRRPLPETVTDLGAFDDAEDQYEYLKTYLPPNFLDTDSGKALASRVEYWLHGRCVSNACVMQGEC